MSTQSYLQELADPKTPLAASKLANLSSLSPDQKSLLVDVWPAMDLRRRKRVIQELVDLAEDNVELDFDAVFFVALADSNPEVRRDAVRGLWEHEGRDLIDPLISLLRDDENAAVRAEAALALGRFALQAELGLLRSSDAGRVEVALRETFENAEEAVEVRGRALEAIGARSVPWVRTLIEEAYEREERRLRLSAVHAMGRSCDAAWLPAVIAELENEDAEMRFEAAGACGSIADEEAVEGLLPLLDDEDAEAQEAAIGALGQIGGSFAKAALNERLEEAEERVREAVLAALEELELIEDPLGVKTE